MNDRNTGAGRSGKSSLTRPLLLAGLGLIMAASFHCRDKEKTSAAPKRIKVQRGPLELFISAPGRVVPRRQVTIKTRAAGEVAEILVKAGDSVSMGSILLRLDPEAEKARLAKTEAEYKAAEALVRQERVKLAQERDNLSRAQSLFDDGLISRADYDAIRRSRSLARDNLEIARSREAATARDLDEARDRFSYTEVKSPLTGIVIGLSVEKGQVVTSGTSGLDSGTPLMTVADLSSLLVEAYIEESDVAGVKSGQAARVTVDAFPGLLLAGEVKEVSPQAEKDGSITVVRALIAIRDDWPDSLRPGMSASVEIVTHEVEDALLAPVSAILERRGKPGAVVIRDGATAWREVTLGPGDWEKVTIESGLTAGDYVTLPPEAIGPYGY